MITGVKLVPLSPHSDHRGCFIELFRRQWDTGVQPVQWNIVHSRKGTLRGVHVHVVHDDYLTVVSGKATIALKDLRPGSPTKDQVSLIVLDSKKPRAIVIPHGVAHGFFFHEPSIHVYAVDHYWNLEDELGCRWDDKDLGIRWPGKAVHLSKRDREATSLSRLKEILVSALTAQSASR
jgi:dTDP-4-dehydrorhamnose 3,5-epimerase